jgi:hypothetical protein
VFRVDSRRSGGGHIGSSVQGQPTTFRCCDDDVESVSASLGQHEIDGSYSNWRARAGRQDQSTLSAT